MKRARRGTRERHFYEKVTCPKCESEMLRMHHTTQHDEGVTERYIDCRACGHEWIGTFEPPWAEKSG